ncbi:helix-turn-helix domain-containing protein [Apilactobacillus micheneri]|uniref:helix-turn-helix domain-containing protein n=1 Tax=Apilactobacillus micheneri TaxID=1899430 RepID=UPI0015E845CE|nr:helix-turn-helix transcriptional regulator [Apilactobacillus micheneri]
MNKNNYKNDALNFGPKLKNIRNSKGFTVRQVALQSNLSASYWSQIENKKREIPTAKTLEKMARGLHVDNNKIFEIAGIKNRNNSSQGIDIAKLIDNGDYMTFQGKELTDEDKELLKRLLRK